MDQPGKVGVYEYSCWAAPTGATVGTSTLARPPWPIRKKESCDNEYMGGARERLIEERENALLSRSHTLSYTPVDLPLYHICAELAERNTAIAALRR